MAKAKKKILVTTPTGSLEYPYIFNTDKYQNEEKYKCSIRIPKSDPETAKLIETIDKALSNHVKLQELQGNTDWNEEHYVPYEEQGDQYVLYGYMHRFGNKGKPDQFEQRPAVFDAQGNPITKKINVFNGSKGKVQYEVYAWDKSQKNCGVTLRLKAVQLISLVDAPVVNAEKYGFSKQDGFDATQVKAEGDAPVERREY